MKAQIAELERLNTLLLANSVGRVPGYDFWFLLPTFMIYLDRDFSLLYLLGFVSIGGLKLYRKWRNGLYVVAVLLTIATIAYAGVRWLHWRNVAALDWTEWFGWLTALPFCFFISFRLWRLNRQLRAIPDSGWETEKSVVREWIALLTNPGTNSSVKEFVSKGYAVGRSRIRLLEAGEYIVLGRISGLLHDKQIVECRVAAKEDVTIAEQPDGEKTLVFANCRYSNIQAAIPEGDVMKTDLFTR